MRLQQTQSVRVHSCVLVAAMLYLWGITGVRECSQEGGYSAASPAQTNPTGKGSTGTLSRRPGHVKQKKSPPAHRSPRKACSAASKSL